MPDKNYRVLSMGGGINTVALLLHKGIDYYDKVIFADTGGENPATYTYLDQHVKPYCKDKFVTVKAKQTLEEYCEMKKFLPDMQARWCTQDFKVKPIRRYVKHTLKCTSDNPCIMDIGIAGDESHRLQGIRHPKYIKVDFPLAYEHITRKQCENIIKAHGWPVPIKSGCYFCPYAGKKHFRKLAHNEPELFDRVIQLEKNFKRYPKYGLLPNGRKVSSIVQGGSGLDDYINIDDNIDADDNIDIDDNTQCDSGHCFV